MKKKAKAKAASSKAASPAARSSAVKKTAKKPAALKSRHAYIASSAPFARPILRKLRELLHRADPRIVETIKWGCPHFEHKGIVASFAAFKEHIRFGFWRGVQVTGESDFMGRIGQTDMTAVKITHLAQIAKDELIINWIRKAVELNEQGAPGGPMAGRANKPRKAPLAPPEDLVAALKKNAVARKVFEAFPPSAQRDYIEWIVEAKQQATREKRLKQAIEWIAEGKRRNWKYEKR
jgi:uncharacterized protein YdeI (YjbR/CyaY-like superfamily)